MAKKYSITISLNTEEKGWIYVEKSGSSEGSVKDAAWNEVGKLQRKYTVRSVVEGALTES